MSGSRVQSWRDAEDFAASYLRRAGFRDVVTTGPGADEGIDLRGTGALGQVKHYSKPVGRPDVQRLFGARGRSDDRLFFFALSGFTVQAIAYATRHDIALISYDQSGAAAPVTSAAKAVCDTVAATEAESAEAAKSADIVRARWEGTHLELAYKAMLGLGALGAIALVFAVAGLGLAGFIAGAGLWSAAVGCFLYLYQAGGTIETSD